VTAEDLNPSPRFKPLAEVYAAPAAAAEGRRRGIKHSVGSPLSSSALPPPRPAASTAAADRLAPALSRPLPPEAPFVESVVVTAVEEDAAEVVAVEEDAAEVVAVAVIEAEAEAEASDGMQVHQTTIAPAAPAAPADPAAVAAAATNALVATAAAESLLHLWPPPAPDVRQEAAGEAEQAAREAELAAAQEAEAGAKRATAAARASVADSQRALQVAWAEVPTPAPPSPPPPPPPPQPQPTTRKTVRLSPCPSSPLAPTLLDCTPPSHLRPRCNPTSHLSPLPSSLLQVVRLQQLLGSQQQSLASALAVEAGRAQEVARCEQAIAHALSSAAGPPSS